MNTKTVLWIVGLAAALLAGAWLNPVVIIPEGSIGVVYNLGKASDSVLGPGFHTRMPFVQDVQQVNIKVQPHDFKEIDAGSKELQSVKLTGKMNFHLDRTKVIGIVRTIGVDYASTMMDAAFQDFVKEVVPQYPTSQILAHREDIRAQALTKMTANLGRYGIIVDDIYIANITFDDAFQQSIEAAQVAAQNAVKEQQIGEQEKARANAKFEQAEGERRAIESKAAGDAAAIRLVGEAEAASIRAKGAAQAAANAATAASMTPALVDYTKWNRWNGTLPQIETGGSGAIIDLRSAATIAESRK